MGHKKYRDCTFLFKLEEGVCVYSYGHECARRAGVSDMLVARAREITKSFVDGMPLRYDNNKSTRVVLLARLVKRFQSLDVTSDIAVLNFIESMTRERDSLVNPEIK
eukprot:GHVR01047451.1.p1 GENE.GHVR01047451.1~~GHVR01047451.1.p1  ORF type:complete len:107 (-),score=22.44 GHVR01047451.1:278-598(-)